MKIVYLGPSPEVNVGGYDEPHRRGEVRDYPDEIGKELLESKKQVFAVERDLDPGERGAIDSRTENEERPDDAVSGIQAGPEGAPPDLAADASPVKNDDGKAPVRGRKKGKK